MNLKKLVIAGTGAALVAVTAVGCASDADTAAHNLSKAAEQFEIPRRVVFFNGITDKYLLSVEGRCSVETSDSALANSLEVTCKVAEGQYKKHFLGLSDNVSYFVEQLNPAEVSVYHYKVIFKPESIIPDIDLETSR